MPFQEGFNFDKHVFHLQAANKSGILYTFKSQISTKLPTSVNFPIQTYANGCRSMGCIHTRAENSKLKGRQFLLRVIALLLPGAWIPLVTLMGDTKGHSHAYIRPISGMQI